MMLQILGKRGHNDGIIVNRGSEPVVTITMDWEDAQELRAHFDRVYEVLRRRQPLADEDDENRVIESVEVLMQLAGQLPDRLRK